MNKSVRSVIIVLIVLAALVFLGYKLSQQNAGGGAIDLSSGKGGKYSIGNTSFSLTHPTSLLALGRDSLPWGGQMPPNNDTMGLVVTYCLKGRRPSMKDPYIQVAYINKKMPSFSAPDSALTWMEKMVTQASETRVLKSRFNVNTLNNRVVRCEELYWGQRPYGEGQIEGKYVAYAYMDYSPKYLLSIVLTSKNEEDFQNVLKDYYYIIRSFQ